MQAPPVAVPALSTEHLSVSVAVRRCNTDIRARMQTFGMIYNAAWFVRHAQFGAEDYRREKCELFLRQIGREAERGGDLVALVYAIGDALNSYVHGTPWER